MDPMSIRLKTSSGYKQRSAASVRHVCCRWHCSLVRSRAAGHHQGDEDDEKPSLQLVKYNSLIIIK